MIRKPPFICLSDNKDFQILFFASMQLSMKSLIIDYRIVKFKESVRSSEKSVRNPALQLLYFTSIVIDRP